MKQRSPTSNVRPDPDLLLQQIADYVLDFRVTDQSVLDLARFCVTDALAGALDALDFRECARLVGPIVPGTTVPCGARVPGTRYELDPIQAAFSFGCMIRWLDYNDQYNGRQGSHPSDTLGGVLMMADHLSRRRVVAGAPAMTMREVLAALVKAYEIQGGIALENDLERAGIDHNLLTRVASTAVLVMMLGGDREQIINAVSNAWMDCSPVLYRHAPNAGWRKSWACADASAQAARYALMAMQGEMGYPSVLTAKFFGLYDARFGGQPFQLSRPFGAHVMPDCFFKFVPAGAHAQSAVECAFRLHPLVKDRLDEIERVEITTHAYLIDVMHKTGPLHNAADRDHCAQYVVAVGLMRGKLETRDFEDAAAADPRIDRLRAKMALSEDPRYTEGFFDATRRHSPNAIQIFFRDGSNTPRIEVLDPLGHHRRRAEGAPVLRAKLESALARRYTSEHGARILALCDDGARFETTTADAFLDLLVSGLRS